MWVAVLFYGIPLGCLIFFFVSLFRYRQFSRQQKQDPGSVDPKEGKKRKKLLTIASVILGVMVLVLVSIMGLLMLAVAFM